MGRACKLAFSYGLESDPTVAAKFLSKLTLKKKHDHIQEYVAKVKPTGNRIPLKAFTDSFSGMPKKSAAHRDGWTWELLRDAAQTPSMAPLLQKFTEHFSNRSLSQDMWAYLASTLLYPFHKKLPEERTSITDPALRPVTVGSVLTRFDCKAMVRMNKVAVAAELLLSHHFSFGINGGVQQVILACNVALEFNPSWVMLDLDSKNARTFCSRERLEEEHELNVAYHYMLESFRALYGKTVTVQWHFGNGPDMSVPLGPLVEKGLQALSDPRGEPRETRTGAGASRISTTLTTTKPLERPPPRGTLCLQSRSYAAELPATREGVKGQASPRRILT